MSSRARRAWSEFWVSTVSKAGVIFLGVLVLASVYVLVTYPTDFGLRYWNNPAYWTDFPKGVPPIWTNYATTERVPEHLIFIFSKPTSSRYNSEAGTYQNFYAASFAYDFNSFPSFLSFSVMNVTYNRRPPVISLELERPDGITVRFYSTSIRGPEPDETPPFRRHFETALRTFLSGESEVAQQLSSFLSKQMGIAMTPSEVNTVGPEKVLFGKLETSAEGVKFTVLKGTYVIRVVLLSYDGNDRVESFRFVVGGKAFGLAGTDALGRDLAVGLLFGFPIALLIGVVTSTLTTAMGTATGVISGYVGGRTDELIQRVSDIINNVPLLPILIFLTFILKPNIWVIVAILVAFGWPGLTIIVRSIVLQVKSSQFIEAAVALGASKWWIMLRHVFPQIAPFIFAQMIFSTPSAILAEAALSFLGLGDPSMPTWGQILDYGFKSGGIYVGYWWWIVPPGLLIVFTAVTFVLLALGLEPVVNPRLRRMR